MRKIKYIVLHCTATPQDTKIVTIVKYWINTLGWKNPGYHFIIRADGSHEEMLSIDKVANGVQGYNSESIHISYIGGVDAKNKPVDNRTVYQKAKQVYLLKDLKQKFPEAEIKGHRDFPGVNKACPSFDVKTWLLEIKFFGK